ncbi:polyisoprenoid-binding protein [Salinicola acroporae]|uniref:Polyisoprenoid-binding protein n=2 Tax=Salinicola acroporae TaxID=1541440 RepID=A0ABT6I1G5_9GAMM|nr:polyisoprenoid-binding protein [Salinicola acroporae]
MLNKIVLAAALLTSTASVSAMAETTTYQMDPTHTSVVASWSHFGFSHPTATFSDVTGTIQFDEDNVANSHVEVTIPVKTVDTKVPALNEEFLGSEYFDVAQYPDATFKSTEIESMGDDRYDVHGDLTLKDVTKPVVLHATLNGVGEHPMAKVPALGFDAETTIQRSDFGLDQYVPNVSDDITIRLSSEAEAAKPSTAQ